MRRERMLFLVFILLALALLSSAVFLNSKARRLFNYLGIGYSVSRYENYAARVMEIELKEKEAEAEYWQGQISLRRRLQLTLTPEDEAGKSFSEINTVKTRKLKELRGEFAGIPVPPGCGGIQKKFLESKDKRIGTLMASMSYSGKLPLAGMSNMQYRESFGDWLQNEAELKSESYKDYRDAWYGLTGRLPADFSYPPFDIMDYEFKVYEANIKGWLATQSVRDEEKKYREWDSYLSAVRPPDECLKIHEEFLRSDRLKIESAKDGIPPGKKAELGNQAALVNEEAWLRLGRLAIAGYRKTLRQGA